MNEAITRIRERIAELRDEFETELQEKREQFQYTIEAGKIRFHAAAKDAHRKLRVGLLKHLSTAPVLYVLTSPFIYACIIPFVMIDIFITVYQRVCFPVYKIPQVRRSDYLRLDRHKLHYLNILQKLNCEYCSYGNGILAYASEVAGRTELFWCPIKHASTPKGYHDHYPDFLDYGDGEDYMNKLSTRRKKSLRGLSELWS